MIQDKELLHQMKNVLRFKVGDHCVVLDGWGQKAKGYVESLHRKGAVLQLSELVQCKAPKRRLRLYCALSKKPSTFEWILQKATELGVSEIIPLLTERCQVKTLRKVDRMELIIKEACEQSEHCFLPKLASPLELESLLKQKVSGELLVGDPRHYDEKLSHMAVTGDINLIIGPEGGLTDAELAAIRKAGGSVFLLGETVLRMETAAIAALSVLQFGR